MDTAKSSSLDQTAEASAKNAPVGRSQRSRMSPGPWCTEGRGTSLKIVFVGKRGPTERKAVCAIMDGDNETREANARAIAAVPELIEALRVLLANVQQDIDEGRLRFAKGSRVDIAVKLSRAALAKAGVS